MGNDGGKATWTYHNATKHSYQSIRSSTHVLDWENQPLPLKIYPKLEPLALPQPSESSRLPALRAVAAPGSEVSGGSVSGLPMLAEILYYSGGITKRVRYPGGEIYFRAAACTGALYHVDLYVVCGDLAGLEAGVYHFGPHDFALRRLRRGDYRSVVARASGEEPYVSSASVIVICASTYWRNAWKYQARAYRHCFWDNGTILANMLATAFAQGVAARVVLGFVDEEVRRLLALDDEREGVLSLVPLGQRVGDHGAGVRSVEPLALETEPLSKSEVDYPAIRAMHNASSLPSPDAVSAWRERDPRFALELPSGATASPSRFFPLRPLSDDAAPRDTLHEVIRRRGSARQFSREPISLSQLSTVLERVTHGVPLDFLVTDGPALNHLYLVVNAVDGLPPGGYVFHRGRMGLELLKEGSFRRDAGYLGLGQEIPADASVDIFFLTDLSQILERWGNRGYRAAQLEASIMAGKIYLAAYALRLGASGLTFFDDDVIEFFSPHASGKSVMFLMALGRSARRK